MEYTNEMNAVYANSITGNPLLDALPGQLTLAWVIITMLIKQLEKSE